MFPQRHPPAAIESIQVCSISFNSTDRILLNGLPIDVVNAMRKAIANNCPIQDESECYHHSYEFKLKGHPWEGQGSAAVYSRRLLAAVLRTMAQFGWNLLQAAKKEFGKDTLFFERGIPEPDVTLFAMSFNMRDRIRVIDAPSFAPCIRDAIKTNWPKGIQTERDYCGAIEFKLCGDPWHLNGSETEFARMLLCQIIANIREKGFKLYGSIGMIGISFDFEDCGFESWIFRRVTPAWILGQVNSLTLENNVY